MLTTNFAMLSQRVKEHVEADSIIQGFYWDSEEERGCFIGCLARVEKFSAVIIYNEKTYGLPIPLQRIAENIFESLPLDEAKNFFASLPEAIGQDGKDLTNIHCKFLASELHSLPQLPQQSVEIQTIIDQVIDGMDLLSQGIHWSEAEATVDAAAAARASANAAGAAYWAAEAAMTAARAAVESAAAANAAVESAARAAASAWAVANADANTFSAAYKASRLRQRDSLLRLIKEAPVKQSY